MQQPHTTTVKVKLKPIWDHIKTPQSSKAFFQGTIGLSKTIPRATVSRKKKQHDESRLGLGLGLMLRKVQMFFNGINGFLMA